MFLRQCFRHKDGKRHAYWALVESYRTDAGPRQRVVAWLGKLDEAGRLGVEQAARGASSSYSKELTTARGERQLSLFSQQDDKESVQPLWVEVNASGVRVENCRQFGGPWLALEVIRRLRLDEFLKSVMPPGREHVSWSRSALILVVARLCRPSSELYVAEQWYPKSAMPELLGIPADRVDDNRLYRTLDQLLPHKAKLEAHLKNRLGELFDLEFDLLMYDITSTYFEGQANFDLAQRGYSRDQRGDCKQVCIGLVVSRCGMPLGYEVFAGNTADVTTVEHIVTTMEKRYGKSDRIWVMDRGMVSDENLDFLRAGGRRYIVGTPKSMLKKFEAELLKNDWNTIRDGLEVKLCARPGNDDEATNAGKDSGGKDSADEDQETFILCRSRDRSQKRRSNRATFRAEDRRAFGVHDSSLRETETRPDESGTRDRSTTGQEHAGGQVVRGDRRENQRRRCSHPLEESRGGSRLGDVECGLLLASQQCNGLERYRVVESVHPTDGGGSRLSHSQERPQNPPDLASEGRPSFGSHLRLFSGLCIVENAWPDVRASRAWQRTASCSGRVGRPTNDGRHPANSQRHRDPQTLSLQANRPPADSPRSPPTPATENNPN